MNNQIHVAILELRAEAESVLTLSHILKLSGYKVSLFLSSKIRERIENTLNRNQIDSLTVFDNSKKFIDIYEEVSVSIKNKKIDIIVLPRFESTSYKETKSYIKFFKENKVLVGMFNYDRWFSVIPRLKFNGLKIIKRSYICDWFYCHLVFQHI